jgi:hypothetical protein
MPGQDFSGQICMSERSELQFALKNPAPVYVSPQNPEAAANPPYHNLMNRT